jgi:hypothetical protein
MQLSLFKYFNCDNNGYNLSSQASLEQQVQDMIKGLYKQLAKDLGV